MQRKKKKLACLSAFFYPPGLSLLAGSRASAATQALLCPRVLPKAKKTTQRDDLCCRRCFILCTVWPKIKSTR
jgi:hypothetical protein